MLPKALLEILVCPLGKAPLREEGNVLVCTKCGPKFAITREGYPNMLIDEAELPAFCKSIEELPCMREQAGATVPMKQ
jgi:uncharacterized protein YbaR (Trm112 family)